MSLEHAWGKVNSCLFVGATRASDGRHELVSVMQAVDLADDVRLSAARSGEDEVVCPGVEGPNIVSAAVAAFRERTGWDGAPVRLVVEKRIPVAAGMAGGSADAAAALRLLAGAAGVTDVALLREIAAGLGADVPAQVLPGRYLATGAGELVEALAPAWPAETLLVLPSDAALSTPAVYAEFDRLRLQRPAADLAARLAEVRAAVGARGAALPPALAVNDLEPAALSLHPPIADALAAVREAGADRAMVSGSGPTVLGVFADPGAARAAAQALRREHPRLALVQGVTAVGPLRA